MDRLPTRVNKADPDYSARREHNLALIETLRERLDLVHQGGGEKYVERHRSRNKMLARERIERIIDPGTAFLELSPLAAYDLYDGRAHSAGIVTGIGSVHGREVLFVANDATVKGGSYYPMTVKKHIRAQTVAHENHLPCVYLVDSGGAFLPMQDEVFPDIGHFGRIFRNQARMSGDGIPQVAAVLGSCTAGGAYVPAMSDESIIVKGNGTIFLAGPPLVKAATGEEVTAEELGGAEVHTVQSGVADHYAEDESEALRMVRNVLENIGPRELAPAAMQEPEPPAHDVDDLLGLIPSDNRTPIDVREIIARIVDGSRFHEFKSRYGDNIGLWFRPYSWPQGWNCCKQWNPLLRIIAQRRPLRRVVWPTWHTTHLLAEHYWIYGRESLRSRWYRQGWCQTCHSSFLCKRSKVHRYRWRFTRSRKLWYVWKSLRPTLPLHVAKQSNFGHGWSASGRRTQHGEARSARTRRQACNGRRRVGKLPCSNP